MKHPPDPHYRHRFPAEIISHAVWLYHVFCLSLRDVELLLAERGVVASYETVRRRCKKFGETFARCLRRRRPRPGDKWHMDEVFIRIQGVQHVSDQYAPFATQIIPATVSEAPYILDGLLMNDTGRRIREHFADTGGFTDHVFAACAILGYLFAPRIRDLPSKRMYVFNPAAVPEALRPLVGGKINEPLIERNWPNVLRISAAMSAGTVTPSLILRKLASYPRQNELAVALREIGRVERTLFMIDWIPDADLRRRAQAGLNKGEAHHALKRAVSFHRRGEIRDRTGEGQHYRIAGMNLLAAAIIYWNTLKLSEAVAGLSGMAAPVPRNLLSHVSPLGWEHINLTGEYRWPTA